MATLSSSIVKTGVATMREVEEALARQVIYGGDLVTNLLELAPVSEPELTQLLAESHSLPAASTGELPVTADEVLRLVPGELALRHAFYPLEEKDGMLIIAVSEPLPLDVEGDLAFSLSVQISQRAAPLIRIRQAVARDYGLPLDRRLLRLVAKLEGRPDPSPSSIPDRFGADPGFPKLPRPASIPPLGYPGIATMRSSDPVMAAIPDSPGSDLPPPRKPTPPPPRKITPPPSAAQESADGRVSTLIARHSPSDGVPAQSATPPPRWRDKAPRRERGRKRHRGPYTAALAEQDLLDADSREDVIGAFFDFASQYFEYSAIFVLQGDIAEGRDAAGPGANRNQIRAIGIPLELPSSLSTAKNSGTFQLTMLGRDGLDQSLAKDLRRKPGRIVLLMPIELQRRCVLLLYGDHGEGDVTLDDIGDVIAFAPLVTAGFERLIVKKKLAARRAVAAEGGVDRSLTPMPLTELRRRKTRRLPPIEQRVQALARALDATPAVPSVSPSTIDDSPQAKSQVPGPTTVVPPTGSESPVAKARAEGSSPPTASESPGARRRHGTADYVSPVRGNRDPPAPLTSSPATAHESPQAKTVDEPRPNTPGESPLGKARVSSAPSSRVVAVGKVSTPPQGTPRALHPHEHGEDQPFPLTRRTPSGRVLPDGKPHAPESDPEAIDRMWDADSNPKASSKPFSKREPDFKSDVGHEAPLAPASRQLAVPPRAPWPRQDAKDRLLPSVIVDVDADCRALYARLVSGDKLAVERLVEIGVPAVSILVSQFPGPLDPSKTRRFAEPDARASECGLVLDTIARIGAVAIPFLVVRTADRDPLVRRFATWLLGELPSADAARAVARRFGDEDTEVRRAALAAGRMMQIDAEARTALRDGLATLAAEPTQPPDVRHGNIEAMAALRDPRAVPRLIPLVGNSNPAIARSAHWALVTLSRQDFEYDTKRWTVWWHKHSDRHRVEWLIESLTHEVQEIRRLAGEELKTLTKEYFGYYEDLPPSERANAQSQYRQWWESKGKARFR